MYELTKAAQALSDETRLRIMNLILTRESCVCEVMQVLGISQTRASRNLKILYDAGFLSQRSDGLFTLYSLKASERFFSDLVAAVKKEMRGNPIARKDLERLAQTRRGDVCGTGKSQAKAPSSLSAA
jgi:ArsR family transcriptional regulator, arsenate/arsenite/antimonite-responsive transcriptional repressor